MTKIITINLLKRSVRRNNLTSYRRNRIKSISKNLETSSSSTCKMLRMVMWQRLLKDTWTRRNERLTRRIWSSWTRHNTSMSQSRKICTLRVERSATWLIRTCQSSEETRVTSRFVEWCAPSQSTPGISAVYRNPFWAYLSARAFENHFQFNVRVSPVEWVEEIWLELQRQDQGRRWRTCCRW